MPHPVIFDRRLLRARRARAMALGPVTFLLDRVADDMAERLSRCCERSTWRPISVRRPMRCGARSPVASVPSLPSRSTRKRCRFATPRSISWSRRSRLQFVNDLPGTLIQIRRALKPDGLFLAAMIGGDSLTELRQAFAQAEAEVEGGVSPRVAPFADLRDLGALLQRAGFALPVTDVDRVTVRYASPLALMHDLRRMGAANALTERRRTPLRRATLRRLLEIYAERFADPDGRIRATFEIVWLSGWAPHESQQQPLKPGSAKTRLADALRTQEISAGEKPADRAGSY